MGSYGTTRWWLVAWVGATILSLASGIAAMLLYTSLHSGITLGLICVCGITTTAFYVPMAIGRMDQPGERMNPLSISGQVWVVLVPIATIYAVFYEFSIERQVTWCAIWLLFEVVYLVCLGLMLLIAFLGSSR